MELIAALKEGIVASFIPTVKEEEETRYRSSSSSGDTTGITVSIGSTLHDLVTNGASYARGFVRSWRSAII